MKEEKAVVQKKKPLLANLPIKKLAGKNKVVVKPKAAVVKKRVNQMMDFGRDVNHDH